MEENNAKDSFTVSKLTIWKALTGIFGVLFVVSLFTNGFGIGDSGSTGAVVAPSAQIPSAPTGPVDVKYDNAAVKGEENAEIVIVEFSDFQCPFCERFYTETLPQIEENYIKTGKAKLAYRHLPLVNLHPQAFKAAEASECANEQGKFWEYHDKIFENQALLSDTIFSTWAGELGLDIEKFDECLSSGKYQDKVSKDMSDADSYGASGTPTFFVNGRILVGAQPFSAFQQAIEVEL